MNIVDDITLIGNSGVQFIDLQIDLSEESSAMKMKTDFFFDYNTEKGEINFVLPRFNEDSGVFVDGKNKNIQIPEERIENYKAPVSLLAFENRWVPIPYFKKEQNSDKLQPGPTGWARMYLSAIAIKEKHKTNNTHSVVLAFDTKCYKDKKGHLVPGDLHLNDDSIFMVDDSLNQAHPMFSTGDQEWFLEWIKPIMYDDNGKPRDRELSVIIDKTDTKEVDQWHRTYIGLAIYLTFLRTMKTAGGFPPVKLCRLDSDIPEIQVDLILDIGNSRSCGLLLETAKVQQPFSFANCSQLELRDLSRPSRVYKEAFDMRCEFAQAPINDRLSLKKQNIENSFHWPSIVRVGPEATWLSIIDSNKAQISGMSSPKRYLWDTQKRVEPWMFNQALNTGSAKPAQSYNDKFTNFFNEEGAPISKHGGMPAIEPRYSRGALMRFALAEIILHAMVQVNSFGFRSHHGQEHFPRKLRRIVLTCPTAMLLTEKQRLREYAQDAVDALREVLGDTTVLDSELEIVPDPALIDPRKLQNSDINKNKIDWGYDEATCVQLVFLYGEIKKRFLNDSRLFFNVIGKQRIDSEYPDKPTVTLASLDIGGGTTDLMICDYQRTPNTGATVLNPKPRFWEGFNLAGDDILKKIIERIVIPGIKLKAIECGCSQDDIAVISNRLFGDHGFMSEHERIMRKHFTNQIGIPIGIGMLQHAVENQPLLVRDFESFFHEFDAPKKNVVDHVEQAFRENGAETFSLWNVSWAVSAQDVNKVVRNVVQKIIGILSGIISQYHCDYLVLAGRPSMLPVIREMFLQYLPVKPDRLISLGNYRIGNWYPFAQGNGLITDPKTTVSVGAAIGLMGGKMGRLEGFKLNTDKLRDEIKSTAKYIGGFDPNKSVLTDIYFNGFEQEQAEIDFHGPMSIGMRQMATDTWIATSMFKLDYASKEDAEALSYRTPFKITLGRSRTNPEILNPTPISVEPRDGGSRPRPDQFKIALQTIIDERGHWMDTGCFTLAEQG